MLTNTALRILRRLLGAPTRSDGPYAGTPTALDGATAVAVTEAGVSEAAGLDASGVMNSAQLAWRAEQDRHRTNLAGSPLSTQSAEGPRGALAATMGQALAGLRATAFLSGPDLAAARDLLQVAAGRRLALVTHLDLRALPAQGAALGSGHEAWHMAADSGCFALMAANVQEAVDFALIARRAAEQALIPGLVAMDGEQTAHAMQDVRLPPAGLVRDFLGRPGDLVPAPTPAQQLLFGETRRRIPRWHDPDRPVLLGATQPTEVSGLSRAAGEAFFDRHLDDLLEAAFGEFAQQTGRRHHRLSAHRMDDASLVLVAQGATVETAEAVAEHLRHTRRMKVGVLGVRCLRPFPGPEAVRLLGTGPRVFVLERLSTPLAEDPPLLRELRAATDRALENGRYKDDRHPGYPALRERDRPRFLSVVYGLGGLPLRAADLAALCHESESIRRPRIYLGLAFPRCDSAYPKRQVLLDRLRRSYPEITDLGLQSAGPGPDLRPQGSVTLAVHRVCGGMGAALVPEAAALLQRILGGGLRARPGLAADWSGHCTDLVSAGPGALPELGERPTLDLAMLLVDGVTPASSPHRDLAREGALLVHSVLPDDTLWSHLPSNLRSTLRGLSARLYRLPPQETPAGKTDFLLGALCAVLLDAGRLDTSPRRLVGLHTTLVQDTTDAQRRTERFKAGLDAPRRIDIAMLPDPPASAEAPSEDEAPSLVRRMGNIDGAYDNLPRFWDQVGVLYRHGDTGELAPDPYLAIGAVPPLSAGFRDLSAARERLPLFRPDLCTGCGDCWSACPDNAVGATALSPARLIAAGIALTGGTALRPLSSKLAAGISELCRDPDTRPATAGELLGRAFERLMARIPFPEERQAAIAAELEAVQAAIGCIPLAMTEPFFGEPEVAEKGRGEALALAVDPGACKGCGICAHACESGALEMQRQGPQSLVLSRRVRRAWEGLPGVDEATIRRLRRHPQVGALAASLLAPSASRSLAGGDGAEPGSGAKLLLRLALAVAEARLAPAFDRYLEEVRDTRDKITGLIRSLLADALPTNDLDALSHGLQGIGAGQADLSSFMGRAEDAMGNQVDAKRLRRLVELARGLADLAWRLAEGRQGTGRARIGTVVAAGCAGGWTAAFPHSPFSGPVTVDPTGDGVQLAAGLLEGQLRQGVEGLLLMRKARLELERPEAASRSWPDLDALSWRDLDDRERALCPSLLLVGDAGVLAGRGLAQLAWLLGTDLPVKTLALADLDLGLAAPVVLDTPLSAVADAQTDLGLLALSRRGAFIAQTSVGDAGHLLDSLERALDFPGPALVHAHAPSPERHGFPTDLTLERARAAIDARVFPLFRYDPRGDGVFGTRLNLEANPAPRGDWVRDGESGAPTPAHWALGERRFADLFVPLAADAREPIELADYLFLDESGRGSRTPFVERGANGGEPQRLRVDDRLVRRCEERLQAWRMLQELAGLVTPFTERVREEAEQRVAAERQAELEAQAADYEARIEGLRARIQDENRREIRERLMHLAGYGRAAGIPEP
jgi:pyruvate-ferredoxin/flavodoxin oxidoreductase